jgi:hypothetical protein
MGIAIASNDHFFLFFLVRCSVLAIFGEVPWLAYYAKKIPGMGEDSKILKEMAVQRAKKRYAAGATNKDIFYYLVC